MADDNYYSVPFEYIKQKVDVRLTRNTVEIFFDNRRISSHIRTTGKRGGYATRDEHMPPNHREYAKWNSDSFRQDAALIGSSTEAVVKAILGNYKVEQQGYKSCASLLKLAQIYSPEQLETACERALTYTASPSLKVIQAMIKSGQSQTRREVPSKPSKYSFTRGADYYGDGGKK